MGKHKKPSRHRTDEVKPTALAEQDLKTVAAVVDLLGRIPQLQSRRSNALYTQFWEYEHLNIGQFEDTEAKCHRLIPEKRSYPSAFIATSLGFTKSSMQVKYNNILAKFHLDSRPVAATLRVALLYERLKYLLIKYYEVQKSRDNHS